MGALLASLAKFDTLPKRLKHFVEVLPDKELFVFYEGEKRESFTAKDVYDLGSKCAALLRKQGFKKNDVIINTLRNSPERLISDVGIIFAGCIPANGQTVMASGEDLYNAAKVSRAPGIVIFPREKDARWMMFERYVKDTNSGLFGAMECDFADTLTTAILVNRKDGNGKGGCLMDELRAMTEPGYVADLVPEDICCLATSSGSTGFYKLIPHPHSWMFANCEEAVGLVPAMDEMAESGSYFCDRPLGWIGGHPLMTWATGVQRVLMDSFYDTVLDKAGELTWWIVKREKCTVGTFVPLDLNTFISGVKADPANSYKLRAILSGGQPIPKSTYDECPLVTDCIITAYGATEVGVIAFGEVNENCKDFYCGRVGPGSTLRFLNDKGEKCKPMEVGEIQIKGRLVMKGYFNRPDLTEKAFTEDGFYKFDDIGFYDENNNVHVIGRKSDVILNGFNNVHPAFVEKQLKKHPKVKEAFVVPVPDPVVYQKICACVLPEDGETLTGEELLEFFNENFVNTYDAGDAPRPQFFMILKELPRTNTGKVDKVGLKARAAELYGKQ